MSNKLTSLVGMHEIEEGARKQIEFILSLDFVKHLSIMPDVHQGYTMPIGGVGLFDNVVSPECVGYDIGCGMCHYNTKISGSSLKESDYIRIKKAIENRVPIGKLSQATKQPYKQFRTHASDFVSLFSQKQQKKIDFKIINDKFHYQLGTLGGGNHFLEIGINDKDEIAVTIHSGSRNPGWRIADFYMRLSKLVDIDLPDGFLRIDSEFGKNYKIDALFAQKFALENRKAMMKIAIEELGIIFDEKNMVNENHNHFEITDNGIIHRKGATPAHKRQIGIIPGSMESGTWITEGLGNEEYLSSSSHGCGRTMSRTKARENLSFEKFEFGMKGIVADVTLERLDESAGAYKDPMYVLDKQNLINILILDHFKPKMVIKGK